ncbi:MAG: glycosyltransferase [Bacteroidales bacterium]|nr:glycosyltransferase [Bacteroidales bacterium]
MRILQSGKFYPIRGGVEKVMWDLTRGLSAHGVDCDMLCATLASDGTDPQDRELEQPDGSLRFNTHGRVIRVKALAKKAATMISPAMVSWLRRHKADYEIIHVHHPDPMAALALRLSGFRGKVVLHWHSDIVSQKFLLSLYRPLQGWLIRRADIIVGTSPVYIKSSPWLKDVQQKCTYVPIGIKPIITDKIASEAVRERFHGKTILFSVGRLVPYKGFSVLIRAMKYLPEKYQLVLGGSGPLRGQLEELIDSENLRGRVCLEGYLSDEALRANYGACDIYVLPSIMKTEAFGIVQIEAMSCGKPVVATIIPGSGVSWVNEDGVSGRNVTPGDPKLMAQAIEDVMDNYRNFSDGALSRFNEMFCEEKMINSIVKIYETLV